MRHDEDCTPIGWGFALFMMAYLAGCIGLVFLIVAQLTAIYWP